MEKQEKSTKTTLIKVLDESGAVSISDLCRTAGVSRFAFYYYLKRDADFRRRVLEKQKGHITKQLAAI